MLGDAVLVEHRTDQRHGAEHDQCNDLTRRPSAWCDPAGGRESET